MIKRWTKAAIECYERHFDCNGCEYQTLEGGCYMKQAVMETYVKLGKPKKEDRFRAKEFETFLNQNSILPEKIADILNLLEGFMYYKNLEQKVQDEREYRLISEINRITREKKKQQKERDGSYFTKEITELLNRL